MYRWFLVGAQFALATLIVLSTASRPFPWFACVFSIPGAMLAISAWRCIGWTRIRIHPSTTDRTVFRTTGPYRIVRHPMYSGLLFFSAPLLFFPWSLWRTTAWLLLLLVLERKSASEEVDLRSRFDEYEQYAKETSRLFPRIKLRVFRRPPADLQ